MANFLLVRHGTTEWVETQILHGITDIPLNAKGRAQAKKTAQSLKDCGARVMYTSPLSRCVETAQMINNTTGLKPLPLDDLIEINFGWLETKKIRSHHMGNYSKLTQWMDRQLFSLARFTSGESKAALKKRVVRVWKTITSENPNGTTIIVGHSGVFNGILFYLFGRAYLNGNPYYYLNPCSITEISINADGAPALVRLNDHSHLLEENL
ncbi:MAG: histidine phosphatase family protein [Anaerolineaceae bacterium]|nr:histidine phosphatase family protein [Anaerolineaceae bacterium]